MSVATHIKRQVIEIRQGGYSVLLRKIKSAWLMLCSYALPILPVLAIRLIRPLLLIRMGGLIGIRIGHFVANTELYLCERDAGINVPRQRYLDIFFISGPVSNNQLAVMWKRVLHIWPRRILEPIMQVNRLLPGGAVHEIVPNPIGNLDVHNLLDRFPSHLRFTPAEEARGEAGLRAMGIPAGASFVCLIARDSAYLDSHYPERDFSYHDYRDSDIQNYVLAAEELAERGFFVIRMGSKVREAMKTSHPKIIDYASNGMRSDFMDIYLGAKCAFCISTGTGWDEIAEMSRRPMVYVNFMPLLCLHTFRAEFISITKKHVLQESQKTLTLREIFSHGVGLGTQSSDYESKGVQLIENTPEEIRDAVVEMVERLNGTWRPHEDDEYLQCRFWEMFQAELVNSCRGSSLHGEIRARFGAAFLRNNREWLQ